MTLLMISPVSRRFVFYVCLSLLLLSGAMSARALTPFPGAAVDEEQSMQVMRYRLILSELTNRQGTISGDDERLLSGQLKRTVWQLPSGVGLTEVMDSVREALQGQRILYQCRAIDCGSSNFWANTVFENPRLVSRDKEQASVVSLVRDGEVNQVTVVYISLRGGRQPRVLVDELTTRDAVTDSAAAAAEYEAALAHSSGWLPELIAPDGELNSDSLQQLNQVLGSLSAGTLDRLHIIVNCYRGTRMDETIGCSDGLVSQMRPLIDSRVVLHSGGALTTAPDKSAQAAVRFVLWPGR